MIISFLGYLPLYFWRQGYITRDPDQPWWKFNFRRQQAHRYSYYMIWCVERYCSDCLTLMRRPISSYPLIYCVLGLPISVARWLQFEHRHVPPTITLASSFIFDLSGLCNVLLFIYTRTGLLLFEKPSSPTFTTEENGDWSADAISMQPKSNGELPAGKATRAATEVIQ
jgi:hypothetical protein